MDTNQAAEAIGIKPRQLRRFLRRVTRGLGLPPNAGERYDFTAEQVHELSMAFWMAVRKEDDE